MKYKCLCVNAEIGPTPKTLWAAKRRSNAVRCGCEVEREYERSAPEVAVGFTSAFLAWTPSRCIIHGYDVRHDRQGPNCTAGYHMQGKDEV
jgi:hypothetical protein